MNKFVKKQVDIFKDTKEYKKLYVQFKATKGYKNKENKVLKFVEKYNNNDIIVPLFKISPDTILGSEISGWEVLEFHIWHPLYIIWYTILQNIEDDLKTYENKDGGK